jgi:hypothetical protein
MDFLSYLPNEYEYDHECIIYHRIYNAVDDFRRNRYTKSLIKSFSKEKTGVEIYEVETLDREGANHRYFGRIRVGKIWYEFTMQSGNWNGDVMEDWSGEYDVPPERLRELEELVALPIKPAEECSYTNCVIWYGWRNESWIQDPVKELNYLRAYEPDSAHTRNKFHEIQQVFKKRSLRLAPKREESAYLFVTKMQGADQYPSG